MFSTTIYWGPGYCSPKGPVGLGAYKVYLSSRNPGNFQCHYMTSMSIAQVLVEFCFCIDLPVSLGFIWQLIYTFGIMSDLVSTFYFQTKCVDGMGWQLMDFASKRENCEICRYWLFMSCFLFYIRVLELQGPQIRHQRPQTFRLVLDLAVSWTT